MDEPENSTRPPRFPLPPRLVLMLSTLTLTIRFTLERDVSTPPWRVALGAAVAVAGLSLTLAAARHFELRRTNIVTFRDPTKLVVDGWFKVSRNPMYLGFALLLAGLALALGGLVTTLPTALFVLAAERIYIPFEERAMARAFGADYLGYSKRVRRWLGRRRSG